MLIFVQNACGQLKHKQTLKNAHKTHADMSRATEEEQYGSEECSK